MNVGKLRAISGVSVVFVHVVFIFFCAIYLKPRITSIETYISTVAMFLPVFGVFVGVVVKNIKLTPDVDDGVVSGAFMSIFVLLFLAYIVGNIFVIYLYGIQYISNESLLPGAIALIESAFGCFFTTLFLTLYQKNK